MITIIYYIWKYGWLVMETDAGRAVMKTPATKAKALFKVVTHIRLLELTMERNVEDLALDNS